MQEGNEKKLQNSMQTDRDKGDRGPEIVKGRQTGREMDGETGRQANKVDGDTN